jgi:hypothetical protein
MATSYPIRLGSRPGFRDNAAAAAISARKAASARQ